MGKEIRVIVYEEKLCKAASILIYKLFKSELKQSTGCVPAAQIVNQN